MIVFLIEFNEKEWQHYFNKEKYWNPLTFSKYSLKKSLAWEHKTSSEALSGSENSITFKSCFFKKVERPQIAG